VTWEVTRPEIKILRADSGFYWELWNNGEPVLQSLKNYPRATVEDFIEWLRQDFAGDRDRSVGALRERFLGSS